MQQELWFHPLRQIWRGCASHSGGPDAFVALLPPSSSIASVLCFSGLSLLLCLFQHQKHKAKFSKSLLKATKTAFFKRQSTKTTCTQWWLKSHLAAQLCTPCCSIFILRQMWNKTDLTSASRGSQPKTSVQRKWELKSCKNLPRHLKSQLINSAVCCICNIQNKIAWGIKACENSLGYETTY